MHIYMGTHTDIRMYLCIYVSMHTRLYTNTLIHTDTYTHMDICVYM